MNNFQLYVPEVKFELIKIKDLVTNQEYQRNLSKTHVNRAAQNFDINQINPVKVSRRNGINYVFNGQHTIEIIALVSNSRETPVWCMVYENMEYKQEADVFANQMKHVKPLLPYEIFIAHIESGSDKHIIINELVESYGLKITPKKRYGSICAVATLERIYDIYGYSTLDRVLKLCIQTWEGEINSFSGNMLSGIAHLIASYDNDLKDNLFIDKLSRISIKEITRTAKSRGHGSLGYAETMLNEYNKKLKYPLRWKNLKKFDVSDINK